MAISDILTELFSRPETIKQQDVIDQFKASYPIYQQSDDAELAQKIAQKYPKDYGFLKTFNPEAEVDSSFVRGQAIKQVAAFQQKYPKYKNEKPEDLAPRMEERFPDQYSGLTKRITFQNAPKRAETGVEQAQADPNEPRATELSKSMVDVAARVLRPTSPILSAVMDIPEVKDSLGRKMGAFAAAEVQTVSDTLATIPAASQFLFGKKGKASEVADKAIQFLDSSAKEWAPVNPTFPDKVAAGAGSMAAFAAAWAVPGAIVSKIPMMGAMGVKIAASLGENLPVVFEAATEAGGKWKEARAKGVKDEDASMAAAKTFMVNLALIKTTNIFGGKAAPATVAKFLANGSREFTQEFGQNLIQEASDSPFINWPKVMAKTLKDPKKLKDAMESGIIGFALGGPLGTAIDHMEHSQLTPGTPAAPGAPAVPGNVSPITQAAVAKIPGLAFLAYNKDYQAKPLQLVDALETSVHEAELAKEAGASPEAVATEAAHTFVSAVEAAQEIAKIDVADAVEQQKSGEVQQPEAPTPVDIEKAVESLTDQAEVESLRSEKKIPRKAAKEIREIASGLRNSAVEIAKAGHDPIWAEARSSGLLPNEDTREQFKALDLGFKLGKKGVAKMRIDEFAASMVEQGIMQPGQGANEAIARLMEYPQRERLPRISDLWTQAEDIWRARHAKKKSAKSKVVQILAENNISDEVGIELVDEIIADPRAYEAGYGEEYSAEKTVIRGATRTRADRAGGLIQLANGATDFTGYHEAWHAVENIVATDAERSVLEHKFAKEAKRLNKNVQEVSADAFANYKLGQSSGNAYVDTVFNRIARFLERMGNWMRLNGFKSADDIFKKYGDKGLSQYSAEEQSLFDIQQPTFDERLQRRVQEGKKSGLNDQQALKYAKDKLAAEEKTRPAASASRGQAVSQKEFGAEGVQGFGQGRQGEGELQFSAESKNLVTIHNLSAEKLRHADKMGGFAVPSIAISRVEHPMSSFGAISLIGDKNLIDPGASAQNKVFNADIYSPRYPSVNYIENLKAMRALEPRLKNAEAYFKGVESIKSPHASWHWSSIGNGEIDNKGREALERDWKLQAIFAAENGADPKADLPFSKFHENDKYQAFIDGIAKDVIKGDRIFKGFTDQGNRRYSAHTLENVLKELKKDLQGGEGFNYGLGSLRSTVAKRYRTMNQIMADRDQILSKEDFEKVKTEVGKEFDEILAEAVEKSSMKTDFGTLDRFTNVLSDAIKQRRSIAAELNEFGFPGMDVNRIHAFLDTIKHMPTEYFEAKVQRIVQLQEFSGAVIPANSPQFVRDILNKRGIEFAEYQSEKDRQSVLAALSKKIDAWKGDILYSAEPREPAPIYFSQMERVVSAKMPNKAGGADVMGILRNAGVKQDEIEWSGIQEWLAEKKSVTKAEVQEFIRQNNVQVKEVMKLSSSNEANRQMLNAGSRIDHIRTRFQVEGYQIEQDPGGIPGEFEITKGGEIAENIPDDLAELANEFSDLQKKIDELGNEERSDTTKFAIYQIPGGENYRELLLTLPPQSSSILKPEPLKELPEGYEVITDMSRPEGNRYGITPPGQIHARFLGAGHPTAALARKEALMLVNNQRLSDWAYEKAKAEAGNVFNSSHFDEPNILAHVRFNDRIDTDGKHVLFIEEVQSDWHQKGRDVGYKTGLENRNLERFKVLENLKKKFEFGSEQWAELNKEQLQISKQNIDLDRSVPNAPFKKTWHELALKRMLRYASENGYDAIAWTTGEQQVDRYEQSLRKAADKILWIKTPKGVQITAFKGGRQVANTLYGENQVSDAIGKSMADMIRSDPNQSGVFEGETIRISDTGMAGFYDQMIPAFLNKYAKKWNSRVGETKISQELDSRATYSGPSYTLEELEVGMSAANRAGNSKTSPFTGEEQEYTVSRVSIESGLRSVIRGMEEGKSFSESMVNNGSMEIAKLLGGTMTYEKQFAEVMVHSLPLTTDMKDSVIYLGQPQYSAEDKKTLTIPEKYRGALSQPSVKETIGEYRAKKSQDIASFKDKILTVFSTRLEKINPILKRRMRQFEFDYRQAISKDMKVSKPFILGMAEIAKKNPGHFAALDLAMKNGDMPTITKIAEFYKLDPRPVTDMLNDIHKRFKSVGFEVGYLPGYFPRQIKDRSGFMAFMEKQGKIWGEIEDAIRQKEQETGRYLNEDEKINLINSFIRGFVRSPITLSKTGNMKSREIAEITPMLNRYYYPAHEALVRYIAEVNEAIEARKFFGRAEVKLPQNRQTDLALVELTDEQKRQSALSFNNIQDSIGAYVNRLLENKMITPAQQAELTDLFRARFGYIATRGIFGLYKNVTYLETIANPISALSQLDDLGTSIYRSAWDAPGSFVRALADKSRITLDDLDLEALSEEVLEMTKTQALLRATLRASGFTFMDRVGKETYMNTSIDKFRSDLKAGKAEAENKIVEIFGPEADQVIEDLKAGKTTENVLFLAFNELSEVQPVTLSEVPEEYLSSPGGRIFYSLKTFMVKRLDFIRNEVRSGKTTPEKLQKFLKLYAIMIVFGAGVDELKDFILGRKTSWSDRLIDNLVKPFGLSKFFLYRVRQEGPAKALFDFITPPHRLIDSIWKDVRYAGTPYKVGRRKEPRALEITASIPLGGKLWYWWYGRGDQKTRAQEARKNDPALALRRRIRAIKNR